MHHSVAQVFIEFCLLTIVLDQYSVVQCAKSLSLKQNNGNNGNKQASKQAAPKKSAPKQRGPARNDTTILAKLASHGKEWHYGESWPEHGFDICGQSAQSPIRLNTAYAEEDNSLHLQLINYNREINQAYLENNGHTVQLGFSDNFEAYIYGSATENRKFIFAQLHFHWGSYNGVGSEHMVDGYRGPMEVHIVHFNAEYGTIENAVTESDGLMVLGALFEISSHDNRAMNNIVKMVREVPKYKDKAYLTGSFRLRQLLPLRLRPFFMYQGSLTTPPCYESVQWLVFKHPVPIGALQEKQFRKCRNEKINENTGRRRTLSNNYRPVQAINERQITISS